MPQRLFTREQLYLVPPSLDEWVPAEHPARFVAMLLEMWEDATWTALGITRQDAATGAPRYAPEALLAIWMYGFMCGIRSVRALEAACREQVPFRWLSGNQTPDHNTLWRFYQTHREAMRGVFQQTVMVAVDAGLVEWTLQAVDGTKIGANAAVTRSLTEAQLAALMERVEREIAALEDQAVADDDDGPPALPPALREATALRTQVQAALARVQAPGGPAKVNLTDPDAPLVKTRQGIVPGYNAQAVVSAVPLATGQPSGRLIVATTVTTAANDQQQLPPLLAQTMELTGRVAALSVADAGYYNAATLAACAELAATVVIPAPTPLPDPTTTPYPRTAFAYDPARDAYICPAGQMLPYRTTKREPVKRQVRLYGAGATICAVCARRPHCTRDATRGRLLKVPVAEEHVRQHRTWMATPAAQTASRQRKSLIEPVFGTLKERLGGRRFLRRGLAAVQSEWHLLAAAVNLRTLVRWWQTTLTPDAAPAAMGR
jgi:transposase